MAEGLFTYEGFSGLWACSIYVNATQAETFHGSADISFRGKFAARLFLACRDRLPLRVSLCRSKSASAGSLALTLKGSWAALLSCLERQPLDRATLKKKPTPTRPIRSQKAGRHEGGRGQPRGRREKSGCREPPYCVAVETPVGLRRIHHPHESAADLHLVGDIRR